MEWIILLLVLMVCGWIYGLLEDWGLVGESDAEKRQANEKRKTKRRATSVKKDKVKTATYKKATPKAGHPFYKKNGTRLNNNRIYSHGSYIPTKRGGKDDEFSRKILDFKDGDSGILKYFFVILRNKNFHNIDAIVYMPSSDATKKTTPVKELAKMLAECNGWIDATDCLVRHTSKEKAAHGGDRSIAGHEKTLVVRNKDKIYNKNVLVLDDVTTSGNSLEAAMKLLRNANVKSVASFALAKTN